MDVHGYFLERFINSFCANIKRTEVFSAFIPCEHHGKGAARGLEFPFIYHNKCFVTARECHCLDL